jgi:hypothetical protein
VIERMVQLPRLERGTSRSTISISGRNFKGALGHLVAMGLISAMCVTATSSAAGTPLDPPAEYNHPYTGELTVHLIDRANVWRECSENGRHKVRRDAAGCAELDGDTCTVYLAKRTRRAPLDAILRHEIAHCNGWPADHPQPPKVTP